MSDLERRIRRLEDRAELSDLVVRYFLAADDDDYEALGACFSPDGEFSAGGFPGGASREEIVEFIRTDRESMTGTVHTPNYVLLEFQGDDSATGVVGAHLELGRGGTTLFAAVRYVDEYVTSERGWQIRKREMRTVHVGPWSDVAESLVTDTPVRWPGVEPSASQK